MFDDKTTRQKNSVFIWEESHEIVSRELVNRFSLFLLWFLLSLSLKKTLQSSLFYLTPWENSIPSLLFWVSSSCFTLFLLFLLIHTVPSLSNLKSLWFSVVFLGKSCVFLLIFLWGCFVCCRWAFIRLHSLHWGNIMLCSISFELFCSVPEMGSWKGAIFFKWGSLIV